MTKLFINSQSGVENSIQAFLHCRRCLEEMPQGTSPREWACIEAGLTPKGVQIWCKRHEINIAHIQTEME